MAIRAARRAAIASLVRDLDLLPDDAERWCDAWERFANHHGVARGTYFWDSGRGWIDAQLADRVLDPSPDRRQLPRRQVGLQPPVATAHRVSS
jgi:hypothetical protein